MNIETERIVIRKFQKKTQPDFWNIFPIRM